MVRHKIIDFSELWKNIPWKKFRRNLFRLQRRLFKAIQAEDTRRARNLQLAWGQNKLQARFDQGYSPSSLSIIGSLSRA